MPASLIITLDGPAGAGKSTTARQVAERLGYSYIDSGAMYRAVTLQAIRDKTPISDKDLGNLAAGLNIQFAPAFGGQRVVMNGEDVSEAIRSEEVTAKVSEVSAFPLVRNAMVNLQREYGMPGKIVMDGRDIGSVVFPNAHVKVFLEADLDVRASRRASEVAEKDATVDAGHVKEALQKRDQFDSQRQESPLVVPQGAVVIDTTHLTIEEQVTKILKLVESYQRTYSMISSYGDF